MCLGVWDCVQGGSQSQVFVLIALEHKEGYILSRCILPASVLRGSRAEKYSQVRFREGLYFLGCVRVWVCGACVCVCMHGCVFVRGCVGVYMCLCV